MKRTIFMWIWVALPVITIIAGSLTLNALLASSAERYLKTFGDTAVSLDGTRMPCTGYFDVGFTVVYRRPRAGAPFFR